jgi:signal transduction histidine kinase
VAELDLARLLAHEIEPCLLSIHLRLRSLADEGQGGAQIESCLAEIETLRAMVRDYSLLEALDLEPRSFPLAPLFENLARRFGPLAAARAIALEVESDPVVVEGDPAALERCLANLLDNAVKFSSEGSRVSVTVRKAADGVQILVEDQGPGIPLSDQERIFEPFVRLDREKPGGGLGLAIARNLAEAQGGKLSVTSEPGKGSRFVLGLPKA